MTSPISSTEQPLEDSVGSAYDQIRAYLMTGSSIFIGLVGLFGNSTAMHVMRSSRKINQSKSYVLLMNQCLVDLVMSAMVPIDLFIKYSLHNSDLASNLYCYIIHGKFFPTIIVITSTYNLVALSLDRMVSVVWPIQHRTKVTKVGYMWGCLALWSYGLILALALSIPVNGPQADGKCHYWNKFSSRSNAQIFSVILNTLYTLLPISLMLLSYTVIYITISTTSIGGKVKMNVIRMLATCVLLFLCCHSLRAYLSIYSSFSARTYFGTNIYYISIILIQCNTIVNPFVYSIQYTDYRIELKRQWQILTRRKYSDDNDCNLSTITTTTN